MAPYDGTHCRSERNRSAGSQVQQATAPGILGQDLATRRETRGGWHADLRSAGPLQKAQHQNNHLYFHNLGSNNSGVLWTRVEYQRFWRRSPHYFNIVWSRWNTCSCFEHPGSHEARKTLADLLLHSVCRSWVYWSRLSGCLWRRTLVKDYFRDDQQIRNQRDKWRSSDVHRWIVSNIDEESGCRSQSSYGWSDPCLYSVYLDNSKLNKLCINGYRNTENDAYTIFGIEKVPLNMFI